MQGDWGLVMPNQIRITTQGAKELDALLAKLPVLVVSSGGPTDRAVRAAGAIVRDRARQIAPRSTRNPAGNSRKKQSKKSKKIWDNKLYTTIRSKVLKYDRASVAVVGPKWDEGNMAHFMQEKPRKLVLWGKATRINPYRIQRNWITQAFDETQSQQNTAMKKVLQMEIAKHMGR